MDLLPYLLFFGLLVIGIRYVTALLLLLKSRFQYPHYTLRPQQDVPDYLQTVFTQPIADLQEFGFAVCGYLEVIPLLRLYPPVTWSVLLYHPDRHTYAELSILRPVNANNLFAVTFYTQFGDRSICMTTNGQAFSILGQIPDTDVQDPYTPSLGAHWHVHQDRIDAMATAKTMAAPSPDEFIAEWNQRLQLYVDGLLAQGLMQATQAGEWRLTLAIAVKSLHTVLQGTDRLTKLTQQRQEMSKVNPALQTTIPIELEVQEFQRTEEMRQGLMGRRLRIWLMIGSVAMFLVIYTRTIPVVSLLLLIGVLILHEGGHLLAMKAFGYRDTTVLFLPFLGALATGHKDNASLSQKFWISLAGPLPGLLLGLGLAIATQGDGYPDWLNELAFMLIFLNLFNLLPIYPLDGGQIADLLIFSRFPYLGVVFKSIGVVCLGLLGLGEPVLLVFAGLIALGIPSSFRSAKVNVQLRRQLPQSLPSDRPSLLHAIFTQIHGLGYGLLPFNSKFTLVKEVINRQQDTRNQWASRSAFVLLYMGSLVGGVTASFEALAPGWLSSLPRRWQMEARHNNYVERYTATQQAIIAQTTQLLEANPKDVNAYGKRAAAKIKLKDWQGGLADYEQALALEPQNLSLRFSYASAQTDLENYPVAMQQYNQILQLNPKNVQAYHYRGELKEKLKDDQGAIADYNRVIQLAPNQVSSYLPRIRLSSRLKNYPAALADANTLIRIQPNSPVGYRIRAEIRRRMGDQAGAKADQQKARSLYNKE